MNPMLAKDPCLTVAQAIETSLLVAPKGPLRRQKPIALSRRPGRLCRCAPGLREKDYDSSVVNAAVTEISKRDEKSSVYAAIWLNSNRHKES